MPSLTASRAILLIIFVSHIAGRTELVKADEDRDVQFCRFVNFRVLRGLEIAEYEYVVGAGQFVL